MRRACMDHVAAFQPRGVGRWEVEIWVWEKLVREEQHTRPDRTGDEHVLQIKR